MNTYNSLQERLKSEPKTWLVTGVAGFIGSNLLEALLKLDQTVVGLDNFITGYQHNLDEVRDSVAPEQWQRFHFVEGDMRDLDMCRKAMLVPLDENEPPSVDTVLHQAAMGSVPRSLEDPILTNSCNIDGFLNMLIAARDAGVKRFVFAASSSTYGDHPGLPKVEDKIGKPLSPYAVTKVVNELYADVFARAYGFSSIGLRYFNIFGKRQDPDGAYAAVIPKWIASMVDGDEVFINGNGETSRDFCYIDNAIQMNLLAATSNSPEAENQIYNVAVGGRTTLAELFEVLRQNLMQRQFPLGDLKPTYRDFRAGDVLHSLADISKARNLLDYAPSHGIDEGVEEAMAWYVEMLQSKKGDRAKNG